MPVRARAVRSASKTLPRALSHHPGAALHYPLALPSAQLDSVTALQVLRHALAAPFPLRISGKAGRHLQVVRQALRLLAGQLGGAPARRVLALSLYALLIKGMHPALDSP